MRTMIRIANGLNTLRDIPPLLFRLLLTFGFFGPFWEKVHNPEAVSQFFGSVGIPAPLFFAWLVLIFEGLGCLFLFFGFATRLISIPLGVIMVVAITTVHWSHGYNPGDNGFAIPLNYLLMLISLFITGPGKVSVDGVLVGSTRRRMEEEGQSKS